MRVCSRSVHGGVVTDGRFDKEGDVLSTDVGVVRDIRIEELSRRRGWGGSWRRKEAGESHWSETKNKVDEGVKEGQREDKRGGRSK